MANTLKTIGALLRKGDPKAAKALGALGGSATSEAKKQAARANARKPRKKQVAK